MLEQILWVDVFFLWATGKSIMLSYRVYRPFTLGYSKIIKCWQLFWSFPKIFFHFFLIMKLCIWLKYWEKKRILNWICFGYFIYRQRIVSIAHHTIIFGTFLNFRTIRINSKLFKNSYFLIASYFYIKR